MPTFTISLSGSTVVNGSKSWTISDADVQSLADFLVAQYTPAASAPLSYSQALLAWVQEFVSTTIGRVQHYQTEKNRQQVATAPPVSFT